jgi:type II secretory pathway predicted ATPase ExeA
MWKRKEQFTKIDFIGRNGSDLSNRENAKEFISTVTSEQGKGADSLMLQFVGLRVQPFGVTPDPSFLYLSPTHREAMASLFYGIEAGRGFLGLIATPGMGKTTLLFHLLQKYQSSARTAFLFQTQCTSREFMRFLIAELGYETHGEDFVRMHEEFNDHVLRDTRAGKRVIVIIDEAQNLEPSVLETIRLLSDFETPQAKLIQIVLAGQPQFADKLASRDMVQLRQRVSLLNRLEPLSSEEVTKYIQHRLQVAGYAGGSLFTPDALEILTDFTQGIPRNINNFCFNALSLACALQQKTIDVAIAQEVIADLDISQHLSEPERLEKGRVVASKASESPPIYLKDLSSLSSARSIGKHVQRPTTEETAAMKQAEGSVFVSQTHDSRQIRPRDLSSPSSAAANGDHVDMPIAEAKEYMEQMVRRLRNRPDRMPSGA